MERQNRARGRARGRGRAAPAEGLLLSLIE